MQSLQPLATFVEEVDTLVVLVHLEMVVKIFHIQKPRRFGLKSLKLLTLKNPKRYKYLNLLELYL